MKVAGVVATGIAAWMAVPWLAMARRGTLDQQAAAAWRAEPRHVRPTPLAEAIPAPRAATEIATETDTETAPVSV